MNIRKLEIFYQTAKCLNMSQVAKDMYISQPAISQYISEIESEIDTKLFDRIGKKLYLTHEGKIFYEYTRRILNIYEEGINVLRSSKSNKGNLVIGASTTIGTYIMPPIINRFNKKEKDIEISMIIDNKHNIEELILNNKVDIAFIEGTVSSKEIILKDIWTDELVFISSINHEWNGKEYLDLEDLKNNKFIIREDGSGTRERFEDFLKDKDIEFDSYIELSNLEAILNYVKLNMGVSCVPYISILSEESLKSINVKNIKFSDYDQTIVDIKSTKEGLMLKALNKLGTTKLKATYQDKTAEITLSVFSDYISSAKLFSDNYYVYLDDKTELSLDTNPENVEAGFFDVFVDDENIATIKDGVISGKTLGKTIMKMDYNGITSTSNLYVIKNRIAIYLMENNSMKEYSEYTTSIKTFNILVKSLDKDITYNDLSFNIDSNGSVNYIEPDIEEPNTFKYAVNLANEGTYNLEFTLNDGSKTGMKIIYKGN